MFFLIACEPDSTPDAVQLEPPIISGPDADDFDAGLAEKALAYDRQMLAINAAPFGMSLDAFISERTWVDLWVSGGSGFSREDFEAATDQDLYDVVYDYDEMGDLGMFGGVAAISEAWRYAILRDDPTAIADDVGAARGRLEQLMRMLHAMQAMTGRKGSLVRGLATRDQPGIDDEEIVPLFDEAGNALPAEKSAVWREDQSGEFPDMLWLDDTSKDQWIGYILALGAAWEVSHDDPDIDPTLVADLVADAQAMGAALQVVNPESGADLTLIDGDGRPTTWHDLNASELEGIVTEEPFNPFNAWMALAGTRVLATVSGDPTIEEFYFSLARNRGYAQLSELIGGAVYFGYLTNQSNVNMAWVAAYNLMHFETDADLQTQYSAGLEGLWGEGIQQAPATFGGAWQSVIYTSLAHTDESVVETALSDLNGWPDAPYWNEYVENCDAAEIAVGACLGVDGSTQITLYGTWEDGEFVPGDSRGVSPVSESLIPRNIRPPSDFEWRSEPYRVNEGGGDRLNPGGDFRAAYWSGRYLRRK